MTEYRTSSFCSGGDCVAVGFTTSSHCGEATCVAVHVDATEVRVRDTKVPDGPVLTFTASEWRDFVAGVKNGEFDPPETPSDAL